MVMSCCKAEDDTWGSIMAAFVAKGAVVGQFEFPLPTPGAAVMRLIPLSQVTATMAQADVLEASEAGRTFLVARLAAIPIWRPIGALLTHRGPKGGIEYPGTAG